MSSSTAFQRDELGRLGAGGRRQACATWKPRRGRSRRRVLPFVPRVVSSQRPCAGMEQLGTVAALVCLAIQRLGRVIRECQVRRSVGTHPHPPIGP